MAWPCKCPGIEFRYTAHPMQRADSLPTEPSRYSQYKNNRSHPENNVKVTNSHPYHWIKTPQLQSDAVSTHQTVLTSDGQLVACTLLVVSVEFCDGFFVVCLEVLRPFVQVSGALALSAVLSLRYVVRRRPKRIVGDDEVGRRSVDARRIHAVCGHKIERYKNTVSEK